VIAGGYEPFGPPFAAVVNCYDYHLCVRRCESNALRLLIPWQVAGKKWDESVM
jgi:hypothetical protein